MTIMHSKYMTVQQDSPMYRQLPDFHFDTGCTLAMAVPCFVLHELVWFCSKEYVYIIPSLTQVVSKRIVWHWVTGSSSHKISCASLQCCT